jgi:hypothetical protein
MHTPQFVALVAQAAIKSGIPIERLGLTIGQDGRFACTHRFPLHLLTQEYGQDASLTQVGTAMGDTLVAQALSALRFHKTKIAAPVWRDGELACFRIYEPRATDAGDDPCEICPVQGCNGSHCQL